jgi:signal transduction histidine kinase
MAGPPDEAELVEARFLLDHLLAIGEATKAAVTRQLHEDIASLMAAATLDLSAATSLLPTVEDGAQARLYQAWHSLESAIDHSRRMVEQLRPSVLDNFGLFAALKWQVTSASYGTRVIYTEWYPREEPTLEVEASTALLRIAEEALAMTFRRAEVTVADLVVQANHKNLLINFTDNGIPQLVQGQERGMAQVLASMRHRLRVFGGTVDIRRTASGATVLTARMPLKHKRPG